MSDMHRNYRIAPPEGLFPWAAWHVDFDGAEDANDDRSFTANSRQALVEEIDEYEDENGISARDVLMLNVGLGMSASSLADRTLKALDQAGFQIVAKGSAAA